MLNKHIEKCFNKIQRRITNLIMRSRTTLIKADTAQYSIQQVTYNGRPIDVQLVFPYGMASIPPLDSEALMFNVLGQGENKAAIVDNSRTRFKGLSEGEVQIGNPLRQTYLYFDSLGNLNINVTGDLNITVNGDTVLNSNTVTMNTSELLVTGDIKANGDIFYDADGDNISVSNIRNIYNIHTHIDSDGGMTTVPNQPI